VVLGHQFVELRQRVGGVGAIEGKRPLRRRRNVGSAVDDVGVRFDRDAVEQEAPTVAPEDSLSPAGRGEPQPVDRVDRLRRRRPVVRRGDPLRVLAVKPPLVDGAAVVVLSYQ